MRRSSGGLERFIKFTILDVFVAALGSFVRLTRIALEMIAGLYGAKIFYSLIFKTLKSPNRPVKYFFRRVLLVLSLTAAIYLPIFGAFLNEPWPLL